MMNSAGLPIAIYEGPRPDTVLQPIKVEMQWWRHLCSELQREMYVMHSFC